MEISDVRVRAKIGNGTRPYISFQVIIEIARFVPKGEISLYGPFRRRESLLRELRLPIENRLDTLVLLP